MEANREKTCSTVQRSAVRARTNSEESPERPCKRRRTSPDRPDSNSSSLSTGQTLKPSSVSAEPSAVSGQRQTLQKRKFSADETQEGPKKRIRGAPVPDEDHGEESRGSSSRKDAGTSETIPAPIKKPVVFSSMEAYWAAGRAAFQQKYRTTKLLGKGGFGSVYAGFRKSDNKPVAIKFQAQQRVHRTVVIQDGNLRTVPLEVVLHQRVQPAEPGAGAAVTLLDWFDLEPELVLVLERPDPCMDLMDYMSCWGRMPECVAKIIAKQLVDALLEIESKGVFHRDIKPENILIETGSTLPRVRIIDFGCGTFLSEGVYSSGKGTWFYLPPEYFQQSYKARPTTVWQLGVVLYSALHGERPFKNLNTLVSVNPPLDESLSIECRMFLQGCLSKNPETRATLQRLKGHPWLE